MIRVGPFNPYHLAFVEARLWDYGASRDLAPRRDPWALALRELR